MDNESKNNIGAIIDVMAEHQAIEDKAWDIFKEAYEREVPPPILESKPKQENTWIYKVMLLGLVGALIVSGLQTIPAFYMVMVEADLHFVIAGIGGISAFFAIDMVMFSAAHYLVQTRWRLRTKSNEENFEKIEQFISIAQWFGFAVSIGSNFYFVFFAYHVNSYIAGIDVGITMIVAVLIALAPAVQGLAIGSVIAALPITEEIEQLRVTRRNRESMADYNDKMRKSWDRKKSRYGVKDMTERIERLQDTQDANLSVMSNLSVYSQTDRQAINRASNAVDMVLRHLQDNPQDANLSVRELGDVVGVGKDSAAKAKKQFLNED